MENENTNPVEMDEGTFEMEESEFDAIWSEEDEPGDAGESAEPEEANEKPEAEETETPEAEKPAPEEPKQEADNQRFPRKVTGQASEVARAKVIELAQKGMDYDRVKEELGRIKADSGTMNRYREQEAFLKELASEANITVDQLMENTRMRVLMGKDESLTEEAARQKVRETQAANRPQASAEKKEEAKAAEPSPEERRQKMFADFLTAYPDVRAEDIPKEVWDRAGQTYDLTGAYRDHEIRQLRAEIQTLRQNDKNKERSTGSRRTAGNASADKAFDDLWYDDD